MSLRVAVRLGEWFALDWDTGQGDDSPCLHDSDPDEADEVYLRMHQSTLEGLLTDAAHRAHNGTDPHIAASEVLREIELAEIEGEA